MKCSYILTNGQQCGAFAMDDSDFCLNHNPLAKDLKIAAVKKGGLSPKKRRHINLPAIPIHNKQDVIPFLISVINEVRTGKLDNKTANALGYVGGMLIKAYEMTEMEERLEKIETLVLERKTFKNY